MPEPLNKEEIKTLLTLLFRISRNQALFIFSFVLERLTGSDEKKLPESETLQRLKE